MTSTQDFLTEFAKAIIHNIDIRPQIVQQWTEKLEAREAELRQGFYKSFMSQEVDAIEVNGQSYFPVIETVVAAKRAAGIE